MTIKTKEALEAYNILNGAKYGKLEDADKIKLWKIVRVLKPIAEKFEEDSKDASERFMQEFDNFKEKLQKAQEYERQNKENNENLPMTEEEYKAFLVDFVKYNKLVSDAMTEYAETEIEVDIKTISEDAFSKLMSSNDWDINQTTKVDFIIE